MVHASSSFLPNNIKICLRVSKLWSPQDFGFRGGNYIIRIVRVVSLVCDMLTGPPHHFYKTLSKICLRVSKLWSAQDFGFRGYNYIMKKKVRVVSLACAMPTGLPLNLYQILSYYLRQYESYGLHKISAYGETTTY